MKLKRSIAIQRELIERLNDLYSLAITCHLTSEEINTRYGKLFERYPKDLPTHVKEYVRGYRECKDEYLYRHCLQFGYKWQEIVYPANWDTLPEELKEACRKGATLEHGHYWKDTFMKDGQETKPYFAHSTAV